MFDFGIDTIFDHLPMWIAKLPETAGDGTDAAAERILRTAQDNCPTATGALQASGYLVTPTQDTYSYAVSSMQSANPDAQATDEVLPTDDHSSVVGFAADYAIYVHDGTWKMAGRPFLAQAVEAEGEAAVGDIGAAIENMGQSL